MTTFEIGERALGPGAPCLLVAELSANHNGSLERAKELIAAAAEAGADAVKLQTYTADTITMDVDNEYFRIQGRALGRATTYELYQEASTPWEWHAELFEDAKRLGLICFSSPFDPTAVEFLEGLACPVYKIASFEVVDVPLLEAVAATGKPVIMSTGMASRSEIEEAVHTLRAGGCPAVCLLSCVSAYPARAEDMKLRNVPWLAETFDCLSGLSDHSEGHLATVAAVTLGACVVEKHLILRRSDGGPDAGFSMEPEELAELVRAVRTVETALAQGVVEEAGASETANVTFRKSLFYAQDLPAGATLTPAEVRVVRPGHGLPPRMFREVMGRTLRQAVSRGQPLRSEDLA